MALIQRQISQKKQLTLVVALLGVLLVTFLVAYFGLIRKDEVPTTPPPPLEATKAPPPLVPGRSGLDSLEKFLTLPAFQKLRQFGPTSLSPTPVGKADPFLVTPQD